MINNKKSEGLTLPHLIPGILIQRYKRFMADVRLESDEVVTVHCPNPGSMKECCEPGSPVYLSYHDNPKRKLKYTWEFVRMPASLVGVNTLLPNRLIFESVKKGLIKELQGYDDIRKEIKVGNHSRIDLLLTKDDGNSCFVEIKNCTLVKDGMAYFPDAVTVRGTKHLAELRDLIDSGCRCVMFYLIQRSDANLFRPADSIDPVYGASLREAVKDGVEILAYDIQTDLGKIWLNQRIPYAL